MNYKNIFEQTLLLEIGDNPLKFKRVKVEPGNYAYVFFVEGIKYIAAFTDKGDNIFEYEFYFIKDEGGKSYNVFQLYSQPMKIVIKVLSTIIAIFKQFVTAFKPHIIFFTAIEHEKSRVSYYRALMRRFNIPGYRAFEDKDNKFLNMPSNEVTFVVLKDDE